MKQARLLTISVFMCLMGMAGVADAAPKYRVAIVKSDSIKPYSDALSGIYDGFETLSVLAAYKVYDLKDQVERADDVIQDITSWGPEVVITIGTLAAESITYKVGALPVVACMVYDPVEAKTMSDRDAFYSVNLKVPMAKQLELLKKYIPHFKRYAVIYRREVSQPIIAAALEAASVWDLKIVPVAIGGGRDFSLALQYARQEAEALIMILDQKLYNRSASEEMLLFSARKSFPIISFSPNYVSSGALLSFSADFRSNGQEAGRMAYGVLKGKPNIEKHVVTEQPWVAWNKKTAKAFHVDITREGYKAIDQIF